MNKQCGFNLVELMTAMLISLLLLTGVIQIFISSRASYHNLEGQAQILENGRYALHILTHHIRMAGLQNTDPSRTTQASGAALLPPVDPGSTAENGDTTADSIGITYYDINGLDCTGTVTAQPATHQFTIQNDSNGNLGLFCNNVLLVEGVKNMQILYGEDTSGNGTADRYLQWNQLGSGEIRSVLITLTLFDARDLGRKVAEKTFPTTVLLRNNQG